MNPEIRYFLACARLACLADTKQWTPQDLMDVCALVEYPIPFETWMKRRAMLPGNDSAPINPAPPSQEIPDPETTATMEAILSGVGKELIDKGILSIQEVKQ